MAAGLLKTRRHIESREDPGNEVVPGWNSLWKPLGSFLSAAAGFLALFGQSSVVKNHAVC